jgi:thiol-disulfide isomerase/thioredoxin
MLTLILLTIKDILKTRFHRGNNLLKILTATLVSMFSLCSAQSVSTRTDSGATPRITRETVPYLVEIKSANDKRETILYFHPDADIKKYPLFVYKPNVERINPISIESRIPDDILDLPIRIVNDPQGRDSITIRELSKDKILVLDFWAKWCSPCIKAMDKWHGLQPKYDKQVLTVGMMLDWDFMAEVMIKEKGWSMPQLVGPEVWLLNAYFCGRSVTGPSAWIKDNVFIGIPDTKADTKNLVDRLIARDISTIPQELRLKLNTR